MKFFDYRYIYLMRKAGTRKHKIGISHNPQTRRNTVDKGIKGRVDLVIARSGLHTRSCHCANIGRNEASRSTHCSRNHGARPDKARAVVRAELARRVGGRPRRLRARVAQPAQVADRVAQRSQVGRDGAAQTMVALVESLTEERYLAMMPAIAPAPIPLSMFTTAMPGAQV